MIYLMVALVVLLIVTPILQVLPSKRDRERMEKRRTAMAQGIGVELVRIDDPDPDPQKYRSSIGKPLPRILSTAAYRLHRGNANSDRDTQDSWRVLRFAGDKRSPFIDNWFWDDAVTTLPSGARFDHLAENLPGLPVGVMRVEEKNQFISVYWDEAGEVTEVVDFLKRTIAL